MCVCIDVGRVVMMVLVLFIGVVWEFVDVLKEGFGE